MSETTSGIAPSAGSKNLFDKLLGENPVPTIPPSLTARQRMDAGDAVHDYDTTDIELLHAETAAKMEIAEHDKPMPQRKIGRRQRMLRETVKQPQTTESVVATPIPNINNDEVSRRIGVTTSPTETTAPTNPLDKLGIAPRGLDYLPVSAVRAAEITELIQSAVPDAQKILKNATGRNPISRFLNSLQNKADTA